MTLLTVVNKAGLKARLNTGNYAFINIAFALLTACGFNIEVDKALAINNSNPQLFRVRGVK